MKKRRGKDRKEIRYDTNGTCVTVIIALAKDKKGQESLWTRLKDQHHEILWTDPDEGTRLEGSHPGLVSAHHFPSFPVVGSCWPRRLCSGRESAKHGQRNTGTRRRARLGKHEIGCSERPDAE